MTNAKAQVSSSPKGQPLNFGFFFGQMKRANLGNVFGTDFHTAAASLHPSPGPDS